MSLIKTIAYRRYIPLLLIIPSALLAFRELTVFLRFNFEFILMLIVLPFIISRVDTKPSVRYGLIGLVCFVLYLFWGLSTLYFIGFVCTIFFLAEMVWGKLSILPLILILMVSPIIIFLTDTIGFEIRLFLSSVAAAFLNILQPGYIAKGNTLVNGDFVFTVDPACMGLKMVILSFFTTIVLVAYFQKKFGRSYSVSHLLFFLGLTFLLVILANLTRIVTITLMQAYPGSVAHETIGIMAFVVYVILPMVWIIARSGRRKTGNTANLTSNPPGSIWRLVLIMVPVLALQSIILFSGRQWKAPGTIDEVESLHLPWREYQFKYQHDNVIQINTGDVLLYLKPPVSFHSADHTPVLCWKGSGYRIVREETLTIRGSKVYYAELHQGDATLYTTWWYDCGSHKTGSQFDWRWKSLVSSEEYRLVNLVCASRDQLICETERLLALNLFSPEDAEAVTNLSAKHL